MGIYVKGMKIPKDCEDCRFCIGLADTEFGTCAGCLIDGDYREASSKSGCPLVEVKEPHGELIDRDALNASINELRKIKPLYKLNEFWELEGTEIMNLIMGSQTVIESEEE